MATCALNNSSLHHETVSHFLRHGYAPTASALGDAFAMGPGEIESALSYTGRISWRGAASAPGGSLGNPSVLHRAHVVLCSPRRKALVGDGVEIKTVLAAEGPPVTIHVDNGRVREDLWVYFPVPMAQAWDNVIYTCANMLLFPNEPAIDMWCGRHAIPRGDAQPAQRVYDFAKAWYGRHRDPDWRKWTAQEASGIFARFGFHGPTWAWPVSAERY